MARLELAIVIPACNEAGTIEKVIRETERFGQPIVVDDASVDMTGELAKQAGAIVMRNQHNLNYDGALSVGLNYAIHEGYQFAMTMDADGQHSARDIPMFIDALNRGADIVIGIRPQAPRMAENMFRIAGRWIWGINDPLCGMKAYRLLKIRHYGKIDTSGSVGTKLAVKMVSDGMKLCQFPISLRMRQDKPRFGGRVKANLIILRALAIQIAFG